MWAYFLLLMIWTLKALLKFDHASWNHKNLALWIWSWQSAEPSVFCFHSVVLHPWPQPEYLVWVSSRSPRCADSHEIHNELIFTLFFFFFYKTNLLVVYSILWKVEDAHVTCALPSPSLSALGFKTEYEWHFFNNLFPQSLTSKQAQLIMSWTQKVVKAPPNRDADPGWHTPAGIMCRVQVAWDSKSSENGMSFLDSLTSWKRAVLSY